MTYLFVAARNYTPGPRTQGPIRLIVVHDMESPETVHTAEDCAFYFAGPNAPQASCHYAVDADSIVQCVHDFDIAWHCPGANHDGIGIEHAGYARQSRDEWLDEYGLSMLRRSADLVVELCDTYGLPAVWLGAAEVAAGQAGITTHRACTEAFHTTGGHTDPGPDFPDDVFMGFVLDAAGKSKPPTSEEDEMSQLEFLVGPILTGELAGRWSKVKPELADRRLRCEFGAWEDGPGVQQIPAFCTSILQLDDPAVTSALGHPVDWETVRVGQSAADPHVVVVTDKNGDYAFRVQ